MDYWGGKRIPLPPNSIIWGGVHPGCPPKSMPMVINVGSCGSVIGFEMEFTLGFLANKVI